VTTDRRAEATSDQRRWAETDDTWGDRPGIVASLWRYRPVVVAVMVMAAVAGYAASALLPVRYEAEATLILRDPGMPGILGGASRSIPTVELQAYVSKQAEIMVSSVVLRRALGLVGSQRPLREVRRGLDVQPSKDLASVTIRATAGDAGAAAAMANAVGSAYQQVTAERTSQEVKRAITSLEKAKAKLQAEIDASPKSPNGGPSPQQETLASRLADLDQREQDINTQAAVYTSGVELFERAERPVSPTQPKPKLNALLGALLGLIWAGAWAWWAAARHQRAEMRDDPAPILGAPLLGEVPRFRMRRSLIGKRLPSPAASDPVVAEAYHFIVASLEHELSSIGGSSVVVTSPAPGDGKTWTAMNIALAAQQENRQVVLIDGDERTRRLSRLCGVPQSLGEGNRPDATFAGDADADHEEYLQQLVRTIVLTRCGMVLPVPAGGIEPGVRSRFFRTPDFRKALLSIGQLFDFVVIDTPALLPVSDAINIAAQADGIVFVVNHGVLLSQLRDARSRLAFVSTPLIGYVFVRRRGFGARAPLLGRRSRLGTQYSSRPSPKGSGW
jgi:succinoglycan biosynthesis transport protein ExoP